MRQPSVFSGDPAGPPQSLIRFDPVAFQCHSHNSPSCQRVAEAVPLKCQFRDLHCRCRQVRGLPQVKWFEFEASLFQGIISAGLGTGGHSHQFLVFCISSLLKEETENLFPIFTQPVTSERLQWATAGTLVWMGMVVKYSSAL